VNDERTRPGARGDATERARRGAASGSSTSSTSRRRRVERPRCHLAPGEVCRVTPREGGRAERVVVRARLASGAQSQVYLARRADGRAAALKVRLYEDEPDHELRIEERILRQLGHEHVVRLLGEGEDPAGRLVLMHERLFTNPLLLLGRPDVRRHFGADPGSTYRPLPPRVGLRLGLDLLRAIEHMHDVGFVHHDVKPGNLLVRLRALERTERPPQHLVLSHAATPAARGVLVDIGATRSMEYLEALNRGEVDSSVVPAMMTPSHAPPEALLPAPNLTRVRLHPSVDVYGAALVVYACASGLAPYEHLGPKRDAAGLLALKARERAGQLLPVSFEALAAPGGVPGWLARDLFAFTRDCVHREPERRPTARVARRRLEELLARVEGPGSS
jgi:serine/threonine protein kinase